MNSNNLHLQRFVRTQEHKLKAKVDTVHMQLLRPQRAHMDIYDQYVSNKMKEQYFSNAHRHNGSHYFDFIPTAID